VLLEKRSSEEFTTLFYCLGSLQKKNSKLFEELANKTVLTEVKSQLLKLSYGNEKQSKALIELSGQIGDSKLKSEQCKMKLRPVCKVTESLIKQVEKKKTVSAQDLSKILLTLELEGGSTQYLYNQAKTFLFMQKEISQIYGIHLEDFNTQITQIANQVEEHIELLEDIKLKIAQNENNNKKDDVNHPVFRYQSPDSWITPVSGRED
jgi:hypothetical protein